MSAAYVCARCARRATSGQLALGRSSGIGAVTGAAAVASRNRAPASRARPQSSSASAAQSTPAAPRGVDFQASGESTVLNGTSRTANGSSNAANRPSQSKHRAAPPWLAHQIQDLVTPDRSPLEIWHRVMALHAFSTSALPESLEIGLRRSPEIRKAFQLFVHTALLDPQPDFPSLETVMRKFLERGLFRYQMLADVLEEARPALASAVLGKQRTEEVEERRALELLGNIMVAWRLTLGASPARMLLASQNDTADWDGLPQPEEVEHFRNESKAYMATFKGLFGGRLDTHLEQRVAADSAWVFVCMEELRRQGRVTEELREAWKPWTDLMWRLLARTKASNRSQIRNILMATNKPASEATLRAAVDSWHRSQVDASKPPKAYPEWNNTTSTEPQKEKQPFEGSPEAKAWRIHIHRAIEQKDERRVLTSWLDFKDVSKKWKNRDDASLVVGDFLWACVRLHLRDMTIGVWRFLQEEGLTPTKTHWAAMIEAARRRGDRTSVRHIWATMLESGYRPPNKLWTTYISSLLRLRDRSTALQAVYAMSQQWKTMPRAGENGKAPSADYQPSMIPINAAVSGLIEMDRLDPIRSLLKTAEEHQLTPTVETYNILLRSAVRRNDHTSIRAIMAEMKASGCEPDVVTFTIYIDGLVKDPASPFNTGTAEEAQAAIATLFADITAIGLQPSPLTYTTLLHNLLGGEAPNIPAAQAVLHQMDAQGIHYSSHAYTILANHYFERNPPDLAAVERLRARIDAEGLDLDARFYDGLVQGYARLGERERMLSVLRRVSDASQLRLWALNDALTLCIQEGDVDSARTLLQQSFQKLRSPDLQKRERQEIRRLRDLAAMMKRDGVIENMPEPAAFRKAKGLEE